MKNYEALAIAMVFQAAKDYEDARRKNDSLLAYESKKWLLENAETFCGIDGQIFIDKINHGAKILYSNFEKYFNLVVE